MRLAFRILLAACLLVGLSASLHAAGERVVDIGGGQALVATPAAPNGALVLVPGGDGHLNLTPEGMVMSLGGNQLVRTRAHYAALGFAVVLVDRPVVLADAVRFARSLARRVTVVATSRGALRVPEALAARPDAIVVTAGLLDELRERLGTPAALPSMLVVHHRQDACFASPPAAAARFQQWSKGRAELHWLEGGTASGNPCRARSHHGFEGLDEKVVAVIAEFARRQRSN